MSSDEDIIIEEDFDDISVEFDNDNLIPIKDINDITQFDGNELIEELDGANIAKHFLTTRNDDEDSLQPSIPTISNSIEKSEKEVSPLSDDMILINNSKVSIKDLQKQLDTSNSIEVKKSIETNNREVFKDLNPYQNLLQKCDVVYYLRFLNNAQDNNQLIQRVRNWDALNLHHPFSKQNQFTNSLREDNLSSNTTFSTEHRPLPSDCFQSQTSTIYDLLKLKSTTDIEQENFQLKKANELLLNEIEDLKAKTQIQTADKESGLSLQTALESKDYVDSKHGQSNEIDSMEKNAENQ